MSRSLLAAGVVIALSATQAAVAQAAPKPVTVFLERGGKLVEHDGEEVAIPKFGGTNQVWSGIVGCVKSQFAPFQIDIVDTQPRGGDFITVVVGGRASQLGLDDRTTNGVGPYIPGRVQRNATVHVFSKVSGERDAQNLCAVAVHEAAHAFGLDHTFKCGDMMSYYLDRCGPRKFLDVDAPCGEFSQRACGDGKRTQNSYRMLVSLVGLRNGQPQPQQPQQPQQPDGGDEHDDADDDADAPAQPQPPTPKAPQTDDSDDDDEQPQPRRWSRGGNGRVTVERFTDRQGRTWEIRRYR